MKHVVANLPFAERMAKDFVCSVCFGAIAAGFDAESVWVVCRNPDCDGTGFVSKAYAEKRRRESFEERWDAQNNLKDILPSKKEKNSSEDELIKSLYG